MKLWVVPVAAAVLGAAVSSIGITEPSVWYDEAATISASTRSLPQLFELLQHVDAVHGAYYLVMHAVFGAVGYSPLSLRIVSALGVAIAAALVVLLDRRLRPGSLGVVAGVVFAVLPRVVWAGGEGRSFAFAAVFAALLTLLLLRGTRISWVLYAATAVVGCLFFVYLALVIVAHGALVLAQRRRMLAPWSIAAAAAALALAPFALVVVGQSSQLPAMPVLGVHTLRDVLVTQWFGSGIALAVVAWVLILLGLARTRWTLLPLLVVPTGILLLAALANPELYQPRYLAMGTPFVALSIAAGVGTLPGRPLRLLVLLGLLALSVPQLVAERAVDAKKDGSWSAVAAIVSAASTERSAVVFGELFPHRATTARTIAVAYPAPFAGMIDVTLGVPAAEHPDDLWGTWLPLRESLGRLARADSVLLITTARDDPDDETLRDAGWMPVREWHEDTITVTQYRRG